MAALSPHRPSPAPRRAHALRARSAALGALDAITMRHHDALIEVIIVLIIANQCSSPSNGAQLHLAISTHLAMHSSRSMSSRLSKIEPFLSPGRLTCARGDYGMIRG